MPGRSSLRYSWLENFFSLFTPTNKLEFQSPNRLYRIENCGQFAELMNANATINRHLFWSKSLRLPAGKYQRRTTLMVLLLLPHLAYSFDLRVASVVLVIILGFLVTSRAITGNPNTQCSIVLIAVFFEVCFDFFLLVLLPIRYRGFDVIISYCFI